MKWKVKRQELGQTGSTGRLRERISSWTFWEPLLADWTAETGLERSQIEGSVDIMPGENLQNLNKGSRKKIIEFKWCLENWISSGWRTLVYEGLTAEHERRQPSFVQFPGEWSQAWHRNTEWGQAREQDDKSHLGTFDSGSWKTFQERYQWVRTNLGLRLWKKGTLS